MISIILPVYNCLDDFKRSIGAFIRFLDEYRAVFEIIVVDDYSEAGEELQLLCVLHNCVYMRNSKNVGKGYSVKRGFEHARGEILIFMDGDFPFDFAVIRSIIDAFANSDTDMVIADRTLPVSKHPSNLLISRKIGSKLLAQLMGRIVTPGFYDTQCGVKAFRRHIGRFLFAQVTQRRFSFDPEIIYLALRNEFVIKRIPVNVTDQGSSTVRILRDGFQMLFLPFVILRNKSTGKYRKYEEVSN